VWWHVPQEFKESENKLNYQELFREHHYKESDEILERRLEHFKDWLWRRRETRIAVVSHSSFLMAFLKAKEKMPNAHCEKLEFVR